MEDIKLFRRRSVPNELIELKDDRVLFCDGKFLITAWNTIRPRKDIASGVSAYLPDKGYKISKVYNAQGEVVYWYCDIIKVVYDAETKTFIYEDLLLDVVVYPDGSVKVLDAAEAAEAFEQGIITGPQLAYALKHLDELLNIIYNGKFDDIQDLINQYEN